MTNPTGIDQTKRLMAALGRMPPKHHADMKLGKKAIAKKKAGLVGDKKKSEKKA